jgi:GGDEF domain-containing protein
MSRRILVVGQARHVSKLLGRDSQGDGEKLRCVPDLDSALQAALEQRPDLLILDLPHSDSGFRRWTRLWDEKGNGEPLTVLPLYTRHRITGLPPMAEVEDEMEHCMDYGEDFCFLYANLNHFRGYNRVHGFAAGDKLLDRMGTLIEETCSSFGAYAGHLGADEFVVFCPLDDGQGLAGELMDRFVGLQSQVFAAEDLARGFLTHLNRQGMAEEIPILGLTLCVIPKVAGNFSHLGEIWNSVAELRSYARKQGGNFIALERRHTPAGFWRNEEGRQGSGTDGL